MAMRGSSMTAGSGRRATGVRRMRERPGKVKEIPLPPG
jgi:hypothetical protein